MVKGSNSGPDDFHSGPEKDLAGLESDVAGPENDVSGRSVAVRAFVGLSRLIDPEENPAGVVYGTLAVGAVLAAESTVRDTFSETIEATFLALVMYWLAHTYTDVVGQRLGSKSVSPRALSPRRLWQAATKELAIVKGASIPIVVLALSWLARATVGAGVTAALWASAVMLGYFEVAAAIRTRDRWFRIALESLFGVALGAGLLVLHGILRH